MSDSNDVSDIERYHGEFTYSTEKDDNKYSDVASTISFPASLNPIINPDRASALDPSNPEFSFKNWAKHILKLQKSDPEKFPLLEMGVSFKGLTAYGYEGGSNYQKTVLNILFDITKIPMLVFKNNKRKEKNKTELLHDFNGLVRSGETCVVLGRPGAGCSTFLKSIACDTYGFHIDESSVINFQGLSQKDIRNHYRGEVVYNAENEVHYPHLTVGDTLKFAALARTPEIRFGDVTRDEYARHMRDVVMASFGLLHTMNTQVGNDYVRGVSGGERRRVSICEVTLGGALVQCFDNSTRGLDSSSALTFIQNAKVGAEISGATVFISLYQASQDAYDLFDKVTVLYLGKQIYFGSAKNAKKFFEDMGYVCIDRQTTGDFLTSLTSPAERVIKPGFEDKVPRTPDEFEAYWKASPEFAELMKEIEEFNTTYPIRSEEQLQISQTYKNAKQSKHARKKSPYFLSYWRQIQICIFRGFQRLKIDYVMTLTSVIGNTIAALLVSSIFYNLPKDTGSFYHRSAALFFAVLFNALSSLLEVFALYAMRPIVEKHNKYAFYHPSADAISSLIVDMPGKIVTSLAFNLVLYFMVNLRREPGPFFIFFLFAMMCVLTMSAMFRTIASVTKSVPQSLAPASFIIMMIITTMGFVIPVVNMHPWIRWINYINPIAYAFEAMMINEYRNREFRCTSIIPSGGAYDSLPYDQRSCSVVGAKPGQTFVNGSDYIIESYEYMPSHLWRNFGIIIAFCVFFHFTYFFFVEHIKGQRSKGEVLIFPRGHEAISNSSGKSENVEAHYNEMDKKAESSGSEEGKLSSQRGVFQWHDVCYDITIKGEPRRLLDHVDGWVKPGTLTALMGASGAGKTTLLDTLADRVTMGVVTGSMLVNGHQRDASFQRKTGYAQQQDIHMATSTVREALEFSALLRQPDTYTKEEKLAYVDEVIKILEMEKYSDAVVGVPGEGLNIEQRKRLTIGVELAARPELLLFLDEPTSGLDSQTAWSVMMLMKKLTNSGQAILCTIHQPSAVLFQQFDRLLLLKSGGQTVYYGDLGDRATKMISYFERNGAHPCPPDANPAEWMLEVIGAAPGSQSEQDWFDIWRSSPEYAQTQEELAQLAHQSAIDFPQTEKEHHLQKSYALPIFRQIPIVAKRAFLDTWRDPMYIWSKLTLTMGLSLFLGIEFLNAENTIQGLQNQLYAIFMVTVIFISMVEQLMVPFVEHRTLYETRERPSKTYSWVTFMTSMFLAEAPWLIFSGTLSFVFFYYPVGFYRNARFTDSVSEKGALFFLLYVMFYLFGLSFGYMIIAAIPDADTGGNINNVLFNICLAMSGVFATKDEMPGFWIFMYYLSPFRYIISALLSTGISGAPVECAQRELTLFPTTPEPGMTCGEFLGPYSNATQGNILNPEALSNCEYCTMSTTDTYLDRINCKFEDAWRNFGIIILYTVFNVGMSYFFYWLGRVPKPWSKKKVEKLE